MFLQEFRFDDIFICRATLSLALSAINCNSSINSKLRLIAVPATLRPHSMKINLAGLGLNIVLFVQSTCGCHVWTAIQLLSPFVQSTQIILMFPACPRFAWTAVAIAQQLFDCTLLSRGFIILSNPYLQIVQYFRFEGYSWINRNPTEAWGFEPLSLL